MSGKKLLIVIPCYNEEEALPSTLKRMETLMNKMLGEKLIDKNSRVMFVDDGSADNTWQILKKGVGKTPFFEALRLSRNFGHQSAILAGMFDNEADIYVTIDADLQDDPDCIVEMLQKIKAGADIVYGVRRERSSDTWFKRVSAQAFYRLLLMLGVKIVYNHADFRMMTRRAVEQLKRFPERNLFLRAVVPLVGFKSDSVYYSRTPRTAGTTKYPLKKMLAFAWNGVSSFFNRTAPAGYPARLSHFAARRRFHHPHPVYLERPRNRCRLVVNHHPHYLLQRRAASFPGRHRRIYRQNFR